MRGFIPAINGQRIAITAFLCALLALSRASSSHAVGDRIYLNGVLVITLKYGNSDAITNRAQSIATRLRNLSQSSNLTLKSNAKKAEIVNGEDTILTITPDEAKEHRQDPKELATQWLARINKALTLPPVKIEKDSLRLPVGITAKLDLTGSEADQSSIDLSNPDVVEVTRDGYTLNIKSKTIGRTTLTMQSP